MPMQCLDGETAALASLVDGDTVPDDHTVGDYEVADWSAREGARFATSAAPFGVLQLGYTPVTSYADPGDLRLKVFNSQ